MLFQEVREVAPPPPEVRCKRKYLHIPKGLHLHLPKTQLVTPSTPSQTGDIDKKVKRLNSQNLPFFLLNIVLSISNFTFFKAYRLHLGFF